MKEFECEVCGNTNPLFFGYFKGEIYCRKCIRFLIKDNIYEDEVFNIPYIDLNYKLTKKQEDISIELLNNFKENKNSLVHAVCGAGKTELTIRVIQYCILNKLKVCFAIPRKDVVIELYYRFKNIFKNNNVIYLCGSHSDEKNGDLIILTTHQLYRYNNFFDLIILDEIDAYPFKNNQVLQSFLKRSLKGNIILMSATFLKEDKEYFKKENYLILELYERFHKDDIPIPTIIKKTGIFKLIYLIKKIKSFIKEDKSLLIFVPTISLSKNLYLFLSLFIKKGSYLNSKVNNRREIIDKFIKKEIKYIVTTSVLERGITIENLQVIIYDSYHKIYDVQTLIQISGRVGRKKNYTKGEIIFLSYKTTKAMKDAINEINYQNTKKQQ